MLKSLSIYSLITIYQAGLSFMAIAYFSFKMPTIVFGEYNLYLAVIPFAINLLMLGASNSIAVFYHSVGLRKFRIYLGQIVFYILPLSFVWGMLLTASFGTALSGYFQLDVNTLYIIMLMLFFQLLPLIVFTYFQAIQDAQKYALLVGSQLSANFIVSIVSFELFGHITAIFIGLLMVNLLFSALSFGILLRHKLFYLRFNARIFKKILVYSTPLAINTSGLTLIFMSDRFFISYYLGNEAVASYSVAIQLSMMILIAVNAFPGAWGPYLFKQLRSNDMLVDKHLVKKIYIASAGFIILPLVLYYIQVAILYVFFDAKYQSATQYIIIISMGYGMMGIYKIFNAFLHYLKKSVLITFFTLITLGLNLVLNYIFIAQYGAIGVAYGTYLSMLLLAIIFIIFTNKYYTIRWNLK